VSALLVTFVLACSSEKTVEGDSGAPFGEEADAGEGTAPRDAGTNTTTDAGGDAGKTDGGARCEPACGSGEFCDASGLCRVCDADRGCAAPELCDAAANGGKGACKVCRVTAATPHDGCTAPTSHCDEAVNGGKGACKVCLATNEGCQGAQTCSADGSACEGCANDASCAPATPVCRTDTAPSTCVECTAASSGRCDATKPACANDFCGCSTDAQCAAVPDSPLDVCDTTAANGRGQCIVCSTDTHCIDPNRPRCDAKVACVCNDNSDCPLDRVCAAGSRACEAAPLAVTPATTSAQIQAFVAAPAGALTPPLPIAGAFVTFIKPAVVGQAAAEPVGFFVQAMATGPAMFVSDAAALGQVHVGDRISFDASVKTSPGGLTIATTVTNLTIVSRGHAVQNLATVQPAGLKRDRSADDTATLVTGVANVASTLVTLRGKIGADATDSTGFASHAITTAGIGTASNDLRLRVPAALSSALDITPGCDFTLHVGPIWRSGTAALPSAFSASDLTIANCPAPTLVAVAPKSLTQLELTFDRTIAAPSIVDVTTQFTFTGGLVATAAQVTGKTVTLTTSSQTAGANYTISVATSVTDTAGKPISGLANTKTFRGFRPTAIVRITEVQPSAANNKDLVELQVISGGSTNGLELFQDIISPTLLATLPDVTVATGDIIVIHLASDVASETTSKTEFPALTNADNYDTAWDIQGGATGITSTNRVLVVRDATGAIQDGVAFTRISGAPPAAFPGDLQRLQAEGHWLPADCSGVPCTYTSTPTAQQVSADWTGIPPSNQSKTSNSIRRVSMTDTNGKDDWAVGAPSWGLPNP